MSSEAEGAAAPAPEAAAEMAQLQGLMGDRSSAYWRGPSAERNQARYLELLKAGSQEEEGESVAPPAAPGAEPDLTDDDTDDEPLHLPPHDYTLPAELAADPLAMTFASFAGAAGLSVELVNEIVGVREHGGQLPRDEQDRTAAMDELRQLWGAKTDANVERVRQYVSRNLPQSLGDALGFPARRADGRALMNDPNIIMTLLGMAKRGAVVAESGGDEIKAIQNLMRTDLAAYRRDPALQMRYSALLHYQSRKKT